jgi:TolA-binding protein
MFRGTSKLIATCLFLALIQGPAYGRSAARTGDAVTGKLAAPTMEDYASHFAESTYNVSPDDLAKADKLRRKTLSSIGELLQGKKKSVRRFELLLRMGELHVERHDYLRDQEMASYAKAHDAWAALPKDKRGKEPKLDVSGSEAEMTKGANAFRTLVNEFPKHPRTDAALYSLAKTLARLGKDTAVDYYKQLVKSHPKSPLIPDTYLALGEYYFDKHNIGESLAYYKKVMQFKTHKVYPYAVYKLGWAHYNAPAKGDQDAEENLKKAVTAFKLVVKLSDKDKKKANFDLRDEAIRDLIMVWADAEDVASAWKYFKTIGEQDSFYKMLERLGNIYFEQGKNVQAIAVFERLLKDSPKRENNPVVHAKLLELYDLTNEIDNVVAELKDMQNLYLGKTAWTTANGKDPKVVADAQTLVEHSMHRYGAMYHQRGQKAKSSEYLKHSAAIYALYLESFPKTANAYDIRYYLAEILFDFKQYEQASGHYMIVAKADEKGKYRKPGALNAVAAMNQMVQAGKYAQLPPAGQVPKPIELPHAKKKLVETIDAYVALLPKEKDGEPMRFTAAQTYFDYGHYDEAISRLDRITREIPDTKQAKAAVRMILAYFGDKQDWNKLIAWAQTYSKADKVLDNDLRKFVVDLLRGAMFKRALAYEKTQNYERAAASFVEYRKEFPSDANADRALYNAMLNFYKVGKVEKALTAGTMLLDKYPKSEVLADTIANMGSTYEALARFEEAAGMYKRLAATFPTDKRSPGALYNAAVLYKGLQNVDAAIALLGEFGRRYPENQIAGDATLELAQLYERRGQADDAVRTYTAYAKKYTADAEQNVFAAAKAATIKTTSLDRSEGLKDLARVAKVLTAKNAPAAFEARAAVAGTLFKLAEAGFGDFQAKKITNGAKIEKEIGDKQDMLVKLAGRYEEVMSIGSPEFTVAALYRLGEAHENFANALFQAPGPKGASQAELDKLKTELEKVAFPLRDEAYKFFETAYKRSREVETFTTWTRRTYQKMVDLAPEKHPAIDEMSVEPSYLSHDLKMSKATESLVTE